MRDNLHRAAAVAKFSGALGQQRAQKANRGAVVPDALRGSSLLESIGLR